MHTLHNNIHLHGCYKNGYFKHSSIIVRKDRWRQIYSMCCRWYGLDDSVIRESNRYMMIMMMVMMMMMMITLWSLWWRWLFHDGSYGRKMSKVSGKTSWTNEIVKCCSSFSSLQDISSFNFNAAPGFYASTI